MNRLLWFWSLFIKKEKSKSNVYSIERLIVKMLRNTHFACIFCLVAAPNTPWYVNTLSGNGPNRLTVTVFEFVRKNIFWWFVGKKWLLLLNLKCTSSMTFWRDLEESTFCRLKVRFYKLLQIFYKNHIFYYKMNPFCIIS